MNFDLGLFLSNDFMRSFNTKISRGCQSDCDKVKVLLMVYESFALKIALYSYRALLEQSFYGMTKTLLSKTKQKI
jgi:hypothetical protein